jgi:hypothetical protein
MGTLDLEAVDLASVTEVMRQRIGTHLAQAELPGRTILRDAVAEHLGCSMLEAEGVVDTLVARGFVRMDRDPSAPPCWRIG